MPMMVRRSVNDDAKEEAAVDRIRDRRHHRYRFVFLASPAYDLVYFGSGSATTARGRNE